jgi:hypothetical protein
MQNGQNELALIHQKQSEIEHISRDGNEYASLTDVCRLCGLNEYDEYDKIRASHNDQSSCFELYGTIYIISHLIPSILATARIREGTQYDKKAVELIKKYAPKNLGGYNAVEVQELIQKEVRNQISFFFNEIQSLKNNQIESNIAKEEIDILNNFKASDECLTPTDVGSRIDPSKKISAQAINKALFSLGWQTRAAGEVNDKSQPIQLTKYSKDNKLMTMNHPVFTNKGFRKILDQNYITPKGLIELTKIYNQKPELFR